MAVFGNVAHAWSEYESPRRRPGRAGPRGMNSVQLLKVGGQWKVLSITWDEERAGNPMARRYPP